MGSAVVRSRSIAVLAALSFAAALLPLVGAPATAQTGTEYKINNFQLVEFIQPQPACTGVGYEHPEFTRDDCGFARVTLDPPDAGKTVTFDVIDSTGETVHTVKDTTSTSGRAQMTVVPEADWAPGEVELRATVADPDSGTASTTMLLNILEATVEPAAEAYAPGENVTIEGTVREVDLVGCCTEVRTEVPADVSVTLFGPDGQQLADPVSTTADDSGHYEVTIDGAATEGLTAGPETDFQLELAAQVDAVYDDLLSGRWAGTSRGPVTLQSVPDTLMVENSFVSSTGWVKPGDTYPFRVVVENFTSQDASGTVVTLPAPPGTSFTKVTALNGAGTASIGDDGTIVWELGAVAAATDAGPTVATLVAEAQAATTDQDPEIVWKDLSSTATLTYDGYSGDALTSESHGPKVIPPGGDFDTARYGDKPFPMVPVDFRDRSHEDDHSGAQLERVVNSPNVEGSTFNLYQEMSYGQLYPKGAVPSAAIATAGFDYGPGFDFTTPDPQGACYGATVASIGESAYGSPLYPERIRDGWYQLPGDTNYYGDDRPAFTLGVVGSIDAACGETSKSVYDAAVIADPEIDYNDFDTDKDGVVDFFMMVFTGLGGNGDSQINGTPPYDNIWPHSSSLEFSYQDDETGLAGYISDDQLTSLTGVPQCWTDTNYQTSDDCAANGGTGQDELPVHVRVGPYNVNPESAIEAASVISHEYGHHLGLPDFYSSWSAYNDWNLMASDYSQHMTIFSKQELGWVVPRFVQPGDELPVADWEEIKNDTGTITWQRPDGTFYTLSADNGDQNIRNGEAYALKLPQEEILDATKVEEQASAPAVWHSGSGNDFGCAPEAGHNLDIALPELANVSSGTPVTVTFKSSWDIEWDWDFGFTMVTTDGATYESLPSQRGYTSTNDYNPNGISCFAKHDNGLTGQSGTYQQGTEEVERLLPAYADGSPFLTDEYDLSEYAGQDGVVLRFSYFTDAGFSRPGWFIDDLEVKAGDQVIYASDFTQDEELRVVSGGCNDGVKTAVTCTDGWNKLMAGEGIDADHGYYLELRDRSGFDLNGRGQSDRGDIGWAPGVLVEYTNEATGYGNNGYPQPPNQHYVDSQPEPGKDCGDNLVETDNTEDGIVLTAPRCQDAAFTAADGDDRFSDSVDASQPTGWIDNFHDDSSEDGFWHFDYGCLTLDLTSMAGDTANTATLPSDLTADATLTAGQGCREFVYPTADGGDGPVNEAPTAAFTFAPESPRPTETVRFDASGSSDDAGIASYTWNFGDGGKSVMTEQPTVDHAYTTTGDKIVTLTVEDADGASASTQQTVTVVENQPPTAEATVSPERPRAGEEATFDGSGSTDPEGDDLTYTWDFGDGTEPGQGEVATHVYHKPGRYTATLTVDDGFGGTATDTVTFTVRGGGNGGGRGGGGEATLAASVRGLGSGGAAALAIGLLAVTLLGHVRAHRRRI